MENVTELLFYLTKLALHKIWRQITYTSQSQAQSNNCWQTFTNECFVNDVNDRLVMIWLKLFVDTRVNDRWSNFFLPPLSDNPLLRFHFRSLHIKLFTSKIERKLKKKNKKKLVSARASQPYKSLTLLFAQKMLKRYLKIRKAFLNVLYGFNC